MDFFTGGSYRDVNLDYGLFCTDEWSEDKTSYAMVCLNTLF